MQTIIYTNSKREAANYLADKICLTDKFDSAAIIDHEMHHYNIKHIQLWFVSSNINNLQGCSQQKMLIEVGRYLVGRDQKDFMFQYLVENYTQVTHKKQTQVEHAQGMKKHLNFAPIKQQSLSSFSILDSNQRQSQDSVLRPSKLSIKREELVREEIKFNNFRQFQLFVYKQQQGTLESHMIRTYIFKTRGQNIRISFIEPEQKELLKRIIDQNCDLIYDARLDLKKRQTLMLEDDRYSKQFPLPVFHNKLILFLVAQQKYRNSFGKRRMTTASFYRPNLSVDALQEWKIKEGKIDHLGKLEKECEIITQEIQNQRVVFLKKMKIIQNQLGDSINIEKLIAEEEESHGLSCTSHLISQQNQKNRRNSKTSALSKFNLTLSGSEFKRLKDKNDALRATQSILNEQNKRIEQLKHKLKQQNRSQQYLVASNAKQLNAIRSCILQTRKQINRKQMEIQQKRKNGIFQRLKEMKVKIPTSQAMAGLQQHKQFLSQLQQTPQSQLTTTRQFSRMLINEPPAKLPPSRPIHQSQHLTRCKPSASTQQLHKMFRDRKLKEVRKWQEVTYTSKEGNKMSQRITLRRPLKQSGQLINGVEQGERMPVWETELTSIKLMEQLIKLYEYFTINGGMLCRVQEQLGSYKLVDQKPFYTGILVQPKAQYTIENLKTQPINATICSQASVGQTSISQVNFPLLSQYIQLQLNQSTEKTAHKQQRTIAREQIKYPTNLFDLLIRKERRNCPNSTSSHHLSHSQNHHYSKSSFQSQQIDEILQNSMRKNNLQLPGSNFCQSVPKKKRMTIEQTIQFKNYLRFSSFQRVNK